MKNTVAKANFVRTDRREEEKHTRRIFEKINDQNSDFSSIQFLLELNLTKLKKNQFNQQIYLKISDYFILYSKVIAQFIFY